MDYFDDTRRKSQSKKTPYVRLSKELSPGDRVKWVYWRHFRHSAWVGEKVGTFIGLCPRKLGWAQVLFYGDKNVSRVPLNEIGSV